ncbi:MAG TPA: glycoside hydrolase family 3 C-terminal domain-containing protein [Acidimicrobiales bacterium]|nr:glycoside hydrolase family 3 C-terminal domain-containing protein [Acidimicrobiales bacterium]
MHADLDAVLARLSLADQVALLAGSGPWHTTPVPQAGIPRLKVTDGPNGARGDGRSGATATCFPVGTALASSWDPDLLAQVGAALGHEAMSKGARVLLGPTVNLHRHPLAGRNFECYSEDPHLTAELAVAFITGLQAEGVGASLKHFVANDSEFERHTISSDVDERTLRELYLVPFERAVAEAEPWTIMAAYNRINGTYACSHHELITEILRGEWGFDGVVVSDWGAALETVANANAGLDLEMPGPARTFGAQLLAAVGAGEVSEATVAAAARRVLRLLDRADLLDGADHDEPAEASTERDEDRELARLAAVRGTVLLRNEGALLPLDPATTPTIALIGPNAETAQIQGGGSSGVKPHRVVGPLEGLRARFTASEITHEVGCLNHKLIPAPDPAWFRPADPAADPDRAHGVTLDYVDGLDPDGEVVHTRTVRRVTTMWMGRFHPDIDPERFACRWRATWTPTETGTHTIGVTSAGRSRVRLDGELLIDLWDERPPGDTFFGRGSAEVRAEVTVEAGTEHDLVVEYARDDVPMLGGITFGILPPVPDDLMERAEAAAAAADVAVVVVGLTGEWETEGNDRADLELPGRQAELVRRVAAANPRTVVVLNSGSPVALDWIDEVPAVLQAWYGGQEMGHALAAVLAGDEEPGGRLTSTWWRRVDDAPSHAWYPGTDGHVRYGEGVLMGYRGADAAGTTPRFEFGFGLGYTTIEVGPARVESDGDDVAVHVTATNTGDRPGATVVQVYVGALDPPVVRPPRELRAFRRVELDPGESADIVLPLGARAFARWDTERHDWVVDPGRYEIAVGRSSRDLGATVVVER